MDVRQDCACSALSEPHPTPDVEKCYPAVERRIRLSEWPVPRSTSHHRNAIGAKTVSVGDDHRLETIHVSAGQLCKLCAAPARPDTRRVVISVSATPRTAPATLQREVPSCSDDGSREVRYPLHHGHIR